MKCRYCSTEKELIICEDCFNFLHKKANESLHSNNESIKFELENIKKEIEGLKNILIEFKIRGLRLKTTKNKLKK